MAWIKKSNARKNTSDGTPTPSVSNWIGDGGLRFNINIGTHKVSLSEYEKDMLVERWDVLEKDFGYGKTP